MEQKVKTDDEGLQVGLSITVMWPCMSQSEASIRTSDMCSHYYVQVITEHRLTADVLFILKIRVRE